MQTMTQKILARHCGREHVKPGELINANLDLVLGNDITSPVAINELKAFGIDQVFDKDKIALVLDHFTPCKDIQSAQLCATVRDFAIKHNITNFFDVGEMGVEHALLPEKGLIAPGELIIGADSHTCTYGALNAFGTGIGSTDMAYGMAKGVAWFKVPKAIRVVLKGALNEYVSGKDVILHLIGRIGVDGALYSSLEFFGDIHVLSMDDRFAMANMAIEAGAKNGIFPFDEKTREYLTGRVNRAYVPAVADEGAEYEQTIEIDLDKLYPTVSKPFLPSNTVLAREIEETPVHQVVIGSCTNGRMEDLRMAAEILKDKRVAKGVRAIVIPATQEIYLTAMKEGLLETFINSGCSVSTPTCGPCLGGHMGILAENEVCVASTNRNFVGRMGHKTSKVYLASPAVCAASAVTGYVTDPNNL